jgi:hypothetical protein
VKPKAFEHALQFKFDPNTGKLNVGENVPEEFKKLLADILEIKPNGAPATQGE